MNNSSIFSHHQVLYIGGGNIFQAGCHIEAQKIGGGNIFGAGCFIGPKVIVGSGQYYQPGHRYE